MAPSSGDVAGVGSLDRQPLDRAFAEFGQRGHIDRARRQDLPKTCAVTGWPAMVEVDCCYPQFQDAPLLAVARVGVPIIRPDIAFGPCLVA